MLRLVQPIMIGCDAALGSCGQPSMLGWRKAAHAPLSHGGS
jgi:hypothetical protein